MTLKQRIERLEALLQPETIKTEQSRTTWNKRPSKVEWIRCWPDDPMSEVNQLDENMAHIYLEPYKTQNGRKTRVVCQMNRGITLYAEYLPIYKDIIWMMEYVQNQLTLQEEQKKKSNAS
jgi:hypothetical protein